MSIETKKNKPKGNAPKKSSDSEQFKPSVVQMAERAKEKGTSSDKEEPVQMKKNVLGKPVFFQPKPILQTRLKTDSNGDKDKKEAGNGGVKKTATTPPAKSSKVNTNDSKKPEQLETEKESLITKLTKLKTESTASGKKIQYSTIKPWITDANTTQGERNAIKSDSVVGKDFFMKILTQSNVVEAMEDLKFDLKTQIEWVRAKAGLTEVKKVIESATKTQRDLVWKDAVYLSTLHGEVGDDYYLWVISKLRMNFKGAKTHTSALDADTAIQTHLSAYVTTGVAEGRQIEGFVAIVDDTNWKIAGEHRYGASVWATKNLAGFKDTEKRVWIHMDKGNIATMVHEGIHKYSLRKLLGQSQPLNEGVTEYFARIVAKGAKLDISSRINYEKNHGTAVKLVALVGKSVVAKAYFDGEVKELKAAFVKKKSEADWTKFLKATKEKKWTVANGFL